jgi:hypothetical protein
VNHSGSMRFGFGRISSFAFDHTVRGIYAKLAFLQVYFISVRMKSDQKEFASPAAKR